MTQTGILLVNLGTPASPRPRDVYHYLIEFLTDPRVIDLPWLYRQLLVRGFIVPARYRQSARTYQMIWTEEGSPLMIYGKRLKEKLQHLMGSDFIVELAMRYQKPSISEGIEALLKKRVDHLVIVPLFPQYASATTGSVHQRVMEVLGKCQVIPKLTFIQEFATHPALIKTFCTLGERASLASYDHIVFSFHGLPKKQIEKSDPIAVCHKNKQCCHVAAHQSHCYAAQCYGGAFAIASQLEIPKERFTISFQSRLGKDPWLEPFTLNVLQALAKEGKKRILVFCPSFVCDCLETLYEIGIEYAKEFKHCGGETLDLVPGLNDESLWIEALKTIIFDNLQQEITTTEHSASCY